MVGLQYISVARCGNYWVYLGYAEDVLANYTDENGNINIDAAVQDGVLKVESNVPLAVTVERPIACLRMARKSAGFHMVRKLP